MHFGANTVTLKTSAGVSQWPWPVYQDGSPASEADVAKLVADNAAGATFSMKTINGVYTPVINKVALPTIGTTITDPDTGTTYPWPKYPDGTPLSPDVALAWAYSAREYGPNTPVPPKGYVPGSNTAVTDFINAAMMTAPAAAAPGVASSGKSGLGTAVAGAGAGFLLGGPIGAAIGGVAGLLLGKRH